MMDVALILVGHGSTRHPDGAGPVLALAEEIRRRGVFAEVEAAFMKQAPDLAEVGRRITAPKVVVIPVLAGKGLYADKLIPAALGLEGPVTRRDGREWRYTAPAGTHARIPGILACRAEGFATQVGMDRTKTSLLLIAHGSSRPGGAGDTPRAITAAMAAMKRFAKVELAFLEQEPKLETWRSLAATRDVVAMPLLVAQGMHASQDIPPVFGLEAGQRGPIEAGGHRVALATGLGAEPELVEVILDMAAEALAV